MDKWKKSLSDDITGDFEQRVLAKARPLLRENAELHAKEKASQPRLKWFYLAVPAGALALAVLVAGPRLRQEASMPADVAALPAEAELEIALDFEMYKDLQEIENLELLKELGDPAKWPTRKKAPKKS